MALFFNLSEKIYKVELCEDDWKRSTLFPSVYDCSISCMILKKGIKFKNTVITV